jgi:hypothetical protein
MATPHVKRLKSGANTRNQFGIIVGAPRPAAATLWRGPVVVVSGLKIGPRRRLCEVGFSPYRPLNPLLETNRGMVVFERREVWDPIEA